MFNHDVKKQAIADLEWADRQYKISVETVQKSSIELFELKSSLRWRKELLKVPLVKHLIQNLRTENNTLE